MLLSPGLQNVAAVSQAIEQCRRHLCIAKHAGPLGEAQVRGDDDAGVNRPEFVGDHQLK
jgi:hypothetical protein